MTISIVAGLALFLVLLLAIPVDLAFDIEKDAGFRKRMRLQWLFGLVKKEIDAGKRGPDGQDPKAERARQSEGRGNLSVPLSLLWTKGFPTRVFRFAAAVFRAVRVREMESEVRVGLGDPAETGWLCAAIWPVLAFAPSTPPFNVKIVPDFHQETFEGYAKGTLRVVPIQFLWLALKFVCSLTTLRALKAAIKARRK